MVESALIQPLSPFHRRCVTPVESQQVIEELHSIWRFEYHQASIGPTRPKSVISMSSFILLLANLLCMYQVAVEYYFSKYSVHSQPHIR